MYLNDQKAWAEQGVVLVNSADSLNATILYGTLTAKYNLKFSKAVTVKHSEVIVCFDVTMVGINTVVLDCQTLGGSNQDVLYMSDSTGYIAYKFPWQAKITGVGRRSIVYRANSTVFLMTATLFDHVDPDVSKNTFINVYRIDIELKQLVLFTTLNADTFGLKELSLTDITYDTLGNIYITDVNKGLFRFVFDGEKIGGLASYSLPNSLQVYTVTTADQRLMVYVATNMLVQELEWTTATATKLTTYEMPEQIKDIRDLQVGTKTILVETDDNYYFYRLGETSVRNTLFIVDNDATVCIMDESSPQAIVVGLKNSVSYVMTDGFVRVINATQDQSVIIDAVSMSGANNKTCSVELAVTSVDPATVGQVMEVKKPPASISLESGSLLELDLEDYYVGARLQYQPKNLSKSVTYDKQTVQDFEVHGADISTSSFLATLSVDSNNYYRVSSNQ